MSDAYSPAMARLITEMYDKNPDLYVTQPIGPPLTFQLLWESDMDRLTHQLEYEGLRVWFTCEVDGIEYRLAARRE